VRILVLEDNPDDFLLLQKRLREIPEASFELEHVSYLKEAKKRLEAGGIDLVFCDLNVSDSQGTETILELIKEAPEIPVVALTGVYCDEKLALDVIQKGAQDYLTKQEIDGKTLVRTARYAVERKRIEEKLKEAKKALEKVNLELDSFVYTASHDLRAPLRAVSSFATFLEEDYQDKLDQQGKDHLKEIRKGTDRMNELIDDLLTLTRVSRIQNPYENVDMNQLIESVIERLKYDLDKFKVELVVQKNIPTVLCDHIKMAEVFANLISNAIKFSSKNTQDTQAHPKVEIGCQNREDVHEFYVRDNGIGIDPQYHDQIFGIFKRLHTAEEYEGTGAGLNIVKRVIDDVGGKIWIESELRKGATFYFTIPNELKKAKKLGEILVEEKLITKEDLTKALKKQAGQRFPWGKPA